MAFIGDGQLSFPSVRIGLSDDIKGNFVRLPSSIVQMLETTPIPIQDFGVEVSFDKIHFYVGWDGHESLQVLNGQPVVQINPILAGIHGLRGSEEATIKVKYFDDSSVATEVYVDPETSDDWEIIEGNALFFQDQMLHQTRIVTTNEKLVCYVDKIVAKFNVRKIVPENLESARLTTHSLIIVKPSENKIRTSNDKESRPVPPYSTHQPNLLRSIWSSNGMTGFEVQVRPEIIKSSFALISVLSNPLETESSQPQSDDKSTVQVAKKIAVRVVPSEKIRANHISLSKLAWNALYTSAGNGEKIQVEFLQNEATDDSPTLVAHAVELSTEPDIITIHGGQNTSVTEDIESFLSSLGDIVLTDKLFLPQRNVYLELLGKSGDRVPFHNWTDNNIGWKFSDEGVKVPKVLPPLDLKEPGNVIGFDHLLQDLIKNVTRPIAYSSGILVHGSSGMGKTMLLQNLAFKLSSETHHYVKYVDCDLLMESSSFPKMKQLLQKLCSICYWHKPSLLIFDNAESVFSSTKSEDEAPAGSSLDATSTKLCQVLITELEKISRKNSTSVRVLFSAKNRDSLNQMLFSKHFIGMQWQLRPPKREQRSEILIKLLNQNSLQISPELDMSTISLETEGYSPRDIALLADKIFCDHLCIHETEGELVDKATFDNALKDFTPSSLRGIKLRKSTGVKWSSIGALAKAKELLLETLEWPTKYAPIFAKCPLRLRSGILLYGYPGCGKTLLASAVAQQCALNFISIKGPEILNKYIGASEQSVREIFERAQAAKPCVLFFDEFDSIAPKRGHDSIGVTDRVVNQMLTQMDGAEGLDGVYVLAATSRPDLIDSALLRPGRLDKSIICGIPDEEERLQILNAVTTSGDMKLEAGCDLSHIAQLTTGFSGADLQGLCYNAYLKAVHRILSDHISPPEGAPESDFEMRCTLLSDNATPPKDFIERIQESLTETTSKRSAPRSAPVVITLQDFKEASAETKPSISASEYKKLSTIYSKFADDRDGTMRSGEASNEIGGRTTLM